MRVGGKPHLRKDYLVYRIFGLANLAADLTPAPEASSDASGRATFEVRQQEVCYTLSVSNLDSPPTGATLERIAGGVILELALPTGGTSSGCETLNAQLTAEMSEAPGRFAVIIRTTGSPDVALSGQLYG
jgi:hypothetical protein